MGIRARNVGMVAVWTSSSPVADPGDTLSQLETSGPPEADPGDMLSHSMDLLFAGCRSWWHIVTVGVRWLRLQLLVARCHSQRYKFRMLIIVALLAADGEDVIQTSPPCWWTRHDSTTVQRDEDTSSTSSVNQQEEEGSIESTEVKKFWSPQVWSQKVWCLARKEESALSYIIFVVQIYNSSHLWTFWVFLNIVFGYKVSDKP